MPKPYPWRVVVRINGNEIPKGFHDGVEAMSYAEALYLARGRFRGRPHWEAAVERHISNGNYAPEKTFTRTGL